MKSAVFYDAKDIRIESVAEPNFKSDEVVVRVRACGFCGSDVEYYFGRSPVGTATGKGPIILGHEFAGEIVEVGGAAADLGQLKVGDRVAVNPIQSCHACDACRAGKPQFCTNLSVLGVTKNGGFAEFAVSKYNQVYKLPDSLSTETGAFVEPLAAAVHAMDRLEIYPGCFVAILGPGPLGLAMIQIAKRLGAGKVVVAGPRDYRLQVALDLGADAVINTHDKNSPFYAEDIVEAVKQCGGDLADRVVVPTSSLQAHDDAFRISGRGSVVVFMGVTGPADKAGLPLFDSLLADRTIKFSLWYPNKWPKTISFLAQNWVDANRIITHRAKLADIGSAIERLTDRSDDVLKTIVIPG